MITLWLIELFANELAILRNYKLEKSQEYTMLQESFKQFLLQSIIQVNSVITDLYKFFFTQRCFLGLYS